MNVGADFPEEAGQFPEPFETDFVLFRATEICPDFIEGSLGEVGSTIYDPSPSTATDTEFLPALI